MYILTEINKIIKFCEQSIEQAEAFKSEAKSKSNQEEVAYCVGKIMAYEDIAMRLIEIKEKLKSEKQV